MSTSTVTDVLGHGIDVIDIGRIEELMSRNEDFLFGWFTKRELSALEARSKSACEPLAAAWRQRKPSQRHFGSGFAGEVSWQDIEILTTDVGAPTVELSGGALEVARSLGVTKLIVSISHGRTVVGRKRDCCRVRLRLSPGIVISALSRSNDTLPP